MTLTDGFGRSINYLRLSVTDRCDFRCVYCMAENMTFLPRAQILTLEECSEIGRAFVELGVSKIRISGGEALVRNEIATLFEQLNHIDGLQELTLTTNGSHLPQYAKRLAAAGVKRINVSLDTLDPTQFQQLTRYGKLDQVLEGINSARQAGIERIKLNTVILKNRNFNQVIPLLEFALQENLDISFIEEMPLGEVTEHGREQEFVSSAQVRQVIQQHYSLEPSKLNTGGPSKYWKISGQDSRIGFISPHSDNFCASCNRVRVTAEGKLLLCLGNENSIDLKAIIRRHPGDRQKLKQAIIDAMAMKPEKHHFYQDDSPQIVRFMNTTGG